MIPEPISSAQARPQLTAFRRGCGIQEQDEPENVMRARLTAAQRKAAPHAGPDDTFPVPDLKHARLAVQMAGHHTGKAKSSILAKVHRLYPSVEIGNAKG
jgi:hypothetical protein